MTRAGADDPDDASIVTAVGATPWYDQRASLRTCEFKADLASVTLASID